MKYTLFLLCLFAASLTIPVTAYAQEAPPTIDSTRIEKSITLKKWQHKHVIRCLGINSMTSPERRNYISDLLKAGIKTLSDSATITVRVPLQLIVDAFEGAANKPEGVVVNDNATTGKDLTPQVMTDTSRWALNGIIGIKGRNAARNEAEKDEVEAYLQQLK